MKETLTAHLHNLFLAIVTGSGVIFPLLLPVIDCLKIIESADPCIVYVSIL